MSRFDGNVAIVTGGSSGIGRATAIAFAREGARVVLTYHRNAQGGEDVVRLIMDAGGEAACFKTDVSKAADVEAMVAKTLELYGHVDYAFNNAGVGVGKSLLETTEDDWDIVMDTNLKGVWLCMKYEIPAMLKQGGGVIVNNASIAGVSFLHGPPVYRASKHGMIALSKFAAAAYRKEGIRVNVVCPGDIRTPAWERALSQHVISKERVEAIEREGYMGKPGDVAEAVVWLCSDAASFITGHALVMDGGRVISRF